MGDGCCLSWLVLLPPKAGHLVLGWESVGDLALGMVSPEGRGSALGLRCCLNTLIITTGINGRNHSSPSFWHPQESVFGWNSVGHSWVTHRCWVYGTFQGPHQL